MLITPASLRALNTGFNNAFNTGFNDAVPTWDRIATRVPSTTKMNTYGWMGQWPAVREWIGDKQVKNLSASAYSLMNKDWESTVGVDRNDIEDDNLGLYDPMFREQGFAARLYPDELVFGLLAAAHTSAPGLAFDGQNFFDVDHPVGSGIVSNYNDTGSGNRWYLLDTRRPLKPIIFQERKAAMLVAQINPTDETVFNSRLFKYSMEARSVAGFGFWQCAYAVRGALNEANYDAARTAMMNMKSPEGKPLNIMPNLLVCGPSNNGAAQRLLNAEHIDGTSNIYYKNADLLVSPWLV